MSGTNRFLLDTNIVLYLLNGDEVLAGLIGSKVPYVSFITEMELLSFRKFSVSQEAKVKSFLQACFIIELNADIKAHAINIRRSYGLKLPDSIIAATSMSMNIDMLTADAEFNKLKSLNILQYKR